MTTYATLKSDLSGYSTHPGLTDAQLAAFIRIGEAMINRDVRTQSMVTSTTLTFTSQSMPLPSDFRAMISLTPQDRGVWDYLPPVRLRESQIWNNSTWVANGNAAYSIEGNNVILAPAPSGDPVADLLYYAGWAALSDTNTTNSLLTNHYDVYLYSSLAALYDRIEDLEQEEKYLTKYKLVVKDINGEAEKARRGDRAGMRRTGTSTP